MRRRGRKRRHNHQTSALQRWCLARSSGHGGVYVRASLAVGVSERGHSSSGEAVGAAGAVNAGRFFRGGFAGFAVVGLLVIAGAESPSASSAAAEVELSGERALLRTVVNTRLEIARNAVVPITNARTCNTVLRSKLPSLNASFIPATQYLVNKSPGNCYLIPTSMLVGLPRRTIETVS